MLDLVLKGVGVPRRPLLHIGALAIPDFFCFLLSCEPLVLPTVFSTNMESFVVTCFGTYANIRGDVPVGFPALNGDATEFPVVVCGFLSDSVD